MALSEQQSAELVNTVGEEAYELIAQRLAALGDLPFRELLPSVVGATNVCLANVLRVAIEQSAPADRAAVAEQLMQASARQLRGLLEPILAAPDGAPSH